MTHTVFCRKIPTTTRRLKQTTVSPMRKGKRFFDTISKKAWEEWQEIQTRLINEKQLNMLDIAARQFIEAEQQKFFDNKDYEDAQGFVPPSNSPN